MQMANVLLRIVGENSFFEEMQSNLRAAIWQPAQHPHAPSSAQSDFLSDRIRNGGNRYFVGPFEKEKN
jgi:hypothetical protein